MEQTWTLRELLRVKSRWERIWHSQQERKRLIQDLDLKIKERNWMDLLEGGRDPKVQWAASEHDRQHVFAWAKAVCRDLEVQYDAVSKNESRSWASCCDKVQRTLKVGDTQVMVFLPTENTPVIASNAPQFDTIDTTKPNRI